MEDGAKASAGGEYARFSSNGKSQRNGGNCSKNVQADMTLKHRFSFLRYGTTARAPTEEDAIKMERFLVAELNLIRIQRAS